MYGSLAQSVVLTLQLETPKKIFYLYLHYKQPFRRNQCEENIPF